MSGPPSKRQQARNERMLQDLIKTVPGNNICADCQARNPGWASWSLGIFLCMRCAALHRKIGTHITKVKSLSMDSWSNEQVETMKRIGNIASNRIYNPQNANIPFPLDSNDSDAAMERYIRQKYQYNPNTAKSTPTLDVESTYTDDRPPPLPPKTGNRFGLRSVSSIFPLSSKYKKESVESNPGNSRQRSLSPRKNKPSRVFGVTVERDNNFDSKNTRLCEMGFTDQKINLTILKGLDGNLEKSIEALVCLAENNTGRAKSEGKPAHSSSASVTAAANEFHPESLSSRLGDVVSSPSSMNPFDRLHSCVPITPPQSSQSTGNLQNQTEGNPYFKTLNTIQIPLQSQHHIEQAFQDMSVNNPPPLFPNRTGPGLSFPISTQPQIYSQHLLPATPSLPQQYYPSTYENHAQQSQQNPCSNPFIQQFNQTAITNTNTLSDNNMIQQLIPQTSQWKPGMQPIANPHSPATLDVSSHQHSNHLRNPYLGQINSPNPGFPYADHLSSQSHGLIQASDNYSQKYENHQFGLPSLPVTSQQLVKADTRSILELYNHPHLAPSRPVSEKKHEVNDLIVNQLSPQQQSQTTPNSISTPVKNSNNPFSSSFPSPATEGRGETRPAQTTGGESQESISNEAGRWLNGRHSPNAWRSISARSTR